MRFDKFTNKTQEALRSAQEIAEQRGHQGLMPAHLFIALLEQPDGVVFPLLGKADIDLDELRERLEASLRKLPQISGGGVESYPTPDLRRYMEAAQEEAKNLSDEYVSGEHCVLAGFDRRSGVLASIFSTVGLTLTECMPGRSRPPPNHSARVGSSQRLRTISHESPRSGDRKSAPGTVPAQITPGCSAVPGSSSHMRCRVQLSGLP